MERELAGKGAGTAEQEKYSDRGRVSDCSISDQCEGLAPLTLM